MSAMTYATRTSNDDLISRIRYEAFRGLYSGEPWQIDLTDDKPIDRNVYYGFERKGYGFVGISAVGMGLFIPRLVATLPHMFERIIGGRNLSSLNDRERLRIATECYQGGMAMVWDASQHYDGEKRQEAVKRTLDDARYSHRYIWLCSTHGDPAVGHKDYQGKYYVDENAPRDVLEYARIKGFKSYQWVIDSPVYMITRPNCRHYMTSLPMDYVMKTDPSTALSELHMRYDEGKRGSFQTLPPRTPKEIRQEAYRNRLYFHMRAFKMRPSAELAGLIEKDKLLLSYSL